MRFASSCKSFICLALLVASAAALSAQTKTSAVPAKAPAAAPAQAPGAQTASQFYLQYRAAFEKAKKIDDLLQYLSADTKKQIEATPAADRPKMFEMIQMMDTTKNVKVVKEERTSTGATLTVEGISEGKKQTGTVKIVREGGALKLGEESWSGSM